MDEVNDIIKRMMDNNRRANDIAYDIEHGYMYFKDKYDNVWKKY